MAARATMATRIPYSGSWRSRWSVIWVLGWVRGRGAARTAVIGVRAHRPSARRPTAAMNARPRAA